jgi:hypothetical protein
MANYQNFIPDFLINDIAYDPLKMLEMAFSGV